MRQRSFLLLVGFACPLATFGGAALGGCQTVIAEASGGGGAGAGRTGVSPDGGFGAGASFDARNDYEDPGCPDAGPPISMLMCDPYHQNNGNCPPGEACYIFSDPPATVCGVETYGAGCGAEGPGTQGAPCGGSGDCAASFTCVVTGSGNQCCLLCELQGSMGCPGGLVCEPIDVQGFGGCL
jgi:hypothetical protein